MSRVIKRIGTQRYALGVGRPDLAGRVKKFWTKIDRDHSYDPTRVELNGEQMVDISSPDPRESRMQFLDNIKQIRRLDFIDGDTSLLWDHFIIQSVKAEVPLYVTRYDGVLVEDISRQNLIDTLVKDFSLKLMIKNIERDTETNKIESEMVLFSSEHLQLLLTFWNQEGYGNNDIKYEANGVGINFISDDLELFTRLEELCAKIVAVKKNEGCIYVLKRAGNGLTLGEAGYAAETLIPDNYSPEVMDKYEHMMEDLKSGSPCGRLSVLSGVAGTGKTYLLKALLKHSNELMFILVRPELVTMLGDPEFVTVLINQRDKDRPYVFILEDADSILTERMADNMGSISAILNTSDGILGSTLDLRIVATTNASKVDFDSAVLRPGRLCTHIEVGKISTEHAHKIFLRETGKNINEAEMQVKSDPNMVDKANKIGFGKNLNNSKGYTLAEVYKTIYLYRKTLEK